MDKFALGFGVACAAILLIFLGGGIAAKQAARDCDNVGAFVYHDVVYTCSQRVP